VRRTVALLLPLLALAGCGSSGGNGGPADTPPKGGIDLSSTAFDDNSTIPKPFTCTGRNVSPALTWKGVPSGTKRLLLVMRDLDAHFLHWEVKGIDADVTSVAQGKKPRGGTVVPNSFGTKGYSGPCPPEGEDAHHYAFTVTALGAKGKVLDRGSLTGTFAR
jgi:Raf kinase inhibitor-like YbhB/YbcL family protein